MKKSLFASFVFGLVAVLVLSCVVFADTVDDVNVNDGDAIIIVGDKTYENNNDIDTDLGEFGTGVGAFAHLVGNSSSDAVNVRQGTITEDAFKDAVGITTVQMSAGNGNAVQSNVGLDIFAAAADDLAETMAVTVEAESYDMGALRQDLISGNAFSSVCGITTVQMSSGNANVLQSSVEVALLARDQYGW